MRTRAFVWLAGMLAFAATSWGQTAQRAPHIGYAFPAGGQQGSAVEVIVGGQVLRGVTDAYITGEGVHASVVQHYPAVRNLMPEQRQELARRLLELRDKRLAELGLQGRPVAMPGVFVPQRPAARAADSAEPPADAEPVKLPAHPLLRDLDSMSLKQLMTVADELLNPQVAARREINTQIAEKVLLKVTIDAGALPGDRELRLATPAGLTNPICFEVGALPEVREQEPDDPLRVAFLPPEPPLELPVVVNGQILPGDVDRFRFNARKGQRLLIDAQARHLMPFLADAVPGWFQAAITLYDKDGNEVAFADHYLFDPDPVLFYEVPEDGTYELDIRDTIYRGREDFVYRVAIGELPFITAAFPLGGRAGTPAVASIDGWDLPSRQLPLDTGLAGGKLRQAVLREGTELSNPVTYAVDTLPEATETEPNDDSQAAERVTLPVIVNGRISQAGDLDVFLFSGHAGDEVVAEVDARRLGSPLDSLLRVIDGAGKVLAWNDDTMQTDGDLHPDMGVITHQADSYLSVKLPADGSYYVQVSDAQEHGGGAYAYRLRISAPRPDFDLLMTPSSLSMPAGSSAAVTVHVLRRDGFAGDVELALRDAPAGFRLSGGQLLNGQDSIAMTITASPQAAAGPVTLQLEGRAQVDGRSVSRPVVPAEDMMQAFLWRHLVPSQQLLTVVRPARGQGRGFGAGRGRGQGRGFRLPPGLKGPDRVEVPAGGVGQVRIDVPGIMRFGQVHLELRDPPEGVSLGDVRVVPGAVVFQVKAEGKAAQAGYSGNLIVEAFVEAPAGGGDRAPAPQGAQRRRFSIGVLPAIPFEVVAP